MNLHLTYIWAYMLGMYALYKAQCGPGLGNPIYNGLHAFRQSAHFWARGGGAIFLKVSRAWQQFVVDFFWPQLSVRGVTLSHCHTAVTDCLATKVSDQTHACRFSTLQALVLFQISPWPNKFTWEGFPRHCQSFSQIWDLSHMSWQLKSNP